jgi:type I restriction enzyme M protein
MSIRSNFFYTRTVPCELWFFDRGKPAERRDQVLMIDARNVYRKVNRTINDFAPEQMANLSAIIWLYRRQKERFLVLVQEYLAAVGTECAAIPPALEKFDTTLAAVRSKIESISDKQLAGNLLAELAEATTAYAGDAQTLTAEVAKFSKRVDPTPPATTKLQHAARQVFDPLAERIKGSIK